MVTKRKSGGASALSSLLTGGVWLASAWGALREWIGGTPPRTEELRHEDVHFEPSDISMRGVLLTGFGILLSMWVITALLYFLYAYFTGSGAPFNQRRLGAQSQVQSFPPEPRLEESPARDLQQLRAQAEYQLHHYAWIDRSQGRVAIPIDRAIDLLVQRGIPPQSAPANMFFEPRVGSRLTGLEGKVEPKIE